MDSRPKPPPLDKQVLHSVNQQPRTRLDRLIPHLEPPRLSNQQEQQGLEEQQLNLAGACLEAAPQPNLEDCLEAINNSKLEVLGQQRPHLDSNKIQEIRQLLDKQMLLVDPHSALRLRPRMARVTPSSIRPPARTR